jgi:hypothetical protein
MYEISKNVKEYFPSLDSMYRRDYDLQVRAAETQLRIFEDLYGEFQLKRRNDLVLSNSMCEKFFFFVPLVFMCVALIGE